MVQASSAAVLTYARLLEAALAGAMSASSGDPVPETHPAECRICFQAMEAGDKVMTYKCGCTFHEDCAGNNENAKGQSYADGLPCPICKMTLADCLDKEEAVLKESAEDICLDLHEASEAAAVAAANASDGLASVEAQKAKNPVQPLQSIQGPQGFGKCMVTCCFCDQAVVSERVMIKSKREQTYKCLNCHNKINAAARHWGSWPPSCWGSLSAAQQKTFFTMPSNKKADIIRQMQTLSRQRDQHKKTDGQKERFLPLSVWEKMGYDVTQIEANTPQHLIEEHPVLGKTYAVAEHVRGNDHSQSVTNDNVLSGAFKNQKVRISKEGEIKMKDGGSDSGGSADSSDSSSEADPSNPKEVAAKAKRKAAKMIAKAKDKAKKEMKRATGAAKRATKKGKKAERKQREVEKKMEAAAKQEAKDTTAKQKENEKKMDFAKRCHPKVVAEILKLNELQQSAAWLPVKESFAAKIQKAQDGLTALKTGLSHVIIDPSVHELPSDLTDMRSLTMKMKPFSDVVNLAQGMAKTLVKQMGQS